MQQLVAQIPWGHNIQIIQKVKYTRQAIWYAEKTLENGWSRNVLAMHIDSRAYERQALATPLDNFAERLPAPGSDLARESIKDPYVFGFLNVGDEAHEREIEAALVGLCA